MTNKFFGSLILLFVCFLSFNSDDEAHAIEVGSHYCPIQPNNTGCAVYQCAMVGYNDNLNVSFWAKDQDIAYSTCKFNLFTKECCANDDDFVCADRWLYTGQTDCLSGDARPFAIRAVPVKGCGGVKYVKPGTGPGDY